MRLSSPPVLVIGGAGRFAGLVVPALVRQGVTVRAFVRDRSKADHATRNGATETAIGDLRDADSLDAALRGVDGVFHIGPAFAPDEAELGLRVVEAARRRGVRKIVFSSVIHPTERLANHRSKVPVEGALCASGIDYTILHPAMFFQNIASGWQAIVDRGVFAEPFPIKAKTARVDYRDVADVVAEAFTSNRLAYGTFELCAGMYDRQEIVALMSAALGRRIEAAEARFEDWAMHLPLDAGQKAALADMFAAYADHGSGGNSLVLRALLGREPRSMRRYVEELGST